MSELAKKQCVPCVKGASPIKGKELADYLSQLEDGWECKNEHHLEKIYTFKNFKDALIFVNDIGHLAEEEGHHPDMHLSWGKVKIEYCTHKIDGLTESDFVMAAKTDAIYITRHSNT